MTKNDWQEFYRFLWGGLSWFQRSTLISVVLITMASIYFGLEKQEDFKTRNAFCLDNEYTHFVISKDDKFYCINEGNGKILKVKDPVK